MQLLLEKTISAGSDRQIEEYEVSGPTIEECYLQAMRAIDNFLIDNQNLAVDLAEVRYNAFEAHGGAPSLHRRKMTFVELGDLPLAIIEQIMSIRLRLVYSAGAESHVDPVRRQLF